MLKQRQPGEANSSVEPHAVLVAGNPNAKRCTERGIARCDERVGELDKSISEHAAARRRDAFYQRGHWDASKYGVEDGVRQLNASDDSRIIL